MDSDGNAAPVVADGHAGIRVNRDRNRVRVTGQSLVDAVVDDLVDHVVQATAIVGVTDIHPRTFAHGFQALENLDGIRAVFFRGLLVFCHSQAS